jgi:hypothetical protein
VAGAGAGAFGDDAGEAGAGVAGGELGGLGDPVGGVGLRQDAPGVGTGALGPAKIRKR